MPTMASRCGNRFWIGLRQRERRILEAEPQHLGILVEQRDQLARLGAEHAAAAARAEDVEVRQDDNALADRAAHDLADLVDHRHHEADAWRRRRQIRRRATVEVEAARVVGLEPIAQAAVDVRRELLLALDQHGEPAAKRVVAARQLGGVRRVDGARTARARRGASALRERQSRQSFTLIVTLPASSATSSWISPSCCARSVSAATVRPADRLIELAAQIAELALELAGDLAAQRLGLRGDPLVELAHRGIAQVRLGVRSTLLGDARLERDLLVELGARAELDRDRRGLEIDDDRRCRRGRCASRACRRVRSPALRAPSRADRPCARARARATSRAATARHPRRERCARRIRRRGPGSRGSQGVLDGSRVRVSAARGWPARRAAARRCSAPARPIGSKRASKSCAAA